MESFSVMTTTAPVFDLGPPSKPLANIISSLGPTVAYAVRFQRVLSSISVSLLVNAYFMARISVSAGQALAVHTHVVTKFAAIVSGKAIMVVWDSKSVVNLRNRLFHELALFILGCGNGIILMLFWPGWWILAGTIWTAWQFWG